MSTRVRAQTEFSTQPRMLGALEAMLGTPNATTLVNGPIAGVY